MLPKFALGSYALQGHVALDSLKNTLRVGDPTIGSAPIDQKQAKVDAAMQHSAVSHVNRAQMQQVIDGIEREQIVCKQIEQNPYLHHQKPVDLCSQQMTLIPSASTRQHFISHLQAQDLVLSNHALSASGQCERNGRETKPPALAPIRD